jgi:hypothetical protein
VIALATILTTLAAATPAPVTLTVRYTAGSQVERVAHLRCRAESARADGFLRTSARPACGRARKIASFLASKPSAKRVCTQIYGGPQRARITGTIGGRRVDRRFRRTNGCHVGDWQYAVPILPRVHGGLML